MTSRKGKDMTTAAAGPERPIDDISKSRSGSGDNHNVASSAIEIIFNSLQRVPRQLLAEPDNSRPHQRRAVCASCNLLRFPIVFSETEIAT